MFQDLNPKFNALDKETFVTYIEIPTDAVALFQGFFDLYEGLGVVRTINLEKTRSEKTILCLFTLDKENMAIALKDIASKITLSFIEAPVKEGTNHQDLPFIV